MKLNLRSRIILIVVAIELLTLMIILIATTIYYYQAHLKQFEIRASEISKLLTVAVGESLMVNQYSSLSELIDAAFFEIEGLTYILVTLENGEDLIEKRSGRDLISKHTISVSNVIMIGSNVIAFLHIHYCMDELYKHLFDHLMALISIGIIGTILSSSWTFYILSKVTDTIIKISNNVDNLIHGEMPNKISISNRDELGDLVNNYNKLVKMVISKKCP